MQPYHCPYCLQEEGHPIGCPGYPQLPEDEFYLRCPHDGPQRVVMETTIGPEHDLHAAFHLECGHRVASFGPDEDMIDLDALPKPGRREHRDAE